MNFNPSGDIQTLAEKANRFLKDIATELEQYRQNDTDIIVGLDPDGRKYWVGKTESSILEQRARAGNTNLVYFIKLEKRIKEQKLVMSL